MVTMAAGRRAVASDTLDTTSHEQLYYQLYNILFRDIVEGQYEVGEQIPSETELVGRYNVSRATVRKAMELLVDNGLIERRRGIGSIVVSNTPTSALNRVTGYLKHRAEDEQPPTKRVVIAEVVAADPSVAEVLEIPVGTAVFHLERVRSSGDVASYLEDVFVVRDYLPDITEHDFSKESLRAYYSNALVEPWPRATQRICAETASSRVGELLGVPEGAALLTIYRTTFNSANVPREYLVKRYRSDRYYLEMSLES